MEPTQEQTTTEITQRRDLRWPLAWAAVGLTSVALVLGSALGRLPISMTEVLGFVTGAVCVMLVVRQSLWNYPVGIANNLFFILLFWQARLYGDMGLQGVYIVLAVIGWYQWLHGGEDHGRLRVQRIRLREAVTLALVGMALTSGFTVYFRAINDASPVLDATTTTLSMVAQWLLNGKRIENWWVWIVADVLYVYLYATRGLYLTSLLYAGFIGLCILGLLAWRRALVSAGGAAGATPLAVES